MGARQSDQAGARVLIVDDDAEVTKTFLRMLQLAGYQARAAVSPVVGLQEATSAPLDALIVDLRMPLMDGVAFVRRLRTDPARRTTPVAIVTGDYLIDDSVIAEAHLLGARVVFKPLWFEDLVSLADSLVAAGNQAAA